MIKKRKPLYNQKDNINNIYKCEFCDHKDFLKRKSYENHLKNKHDNEIYCTSSISRNYSLHDREIIENSPVNSFWGNGPDDNGQNMVGKIWMEIRKEI